jgi:hypothetical protein
MSCEHAPGVRFALAEGDGVHPGSLEPETESADTTEEVEDIHTPGLLIDAAKLYARAVRSPSH